MAHRLDVVPVRVEHERAVVVRVVVRADARRAVVLAARRHCGLVERVDDGAVLRADRDVHRPVGSPSPPIQKSGLPPTPKPRPRSARLLHSITSSYPSGASACL